MARGRLRVYLGAAPGVGKSHAMVEEGVRRAGRGADQIELVDMSPEALRRRLAHGHVYPPDRIDTALANMFRPEVLGKLRQLTLLWLADRVEEQLERQTLTGEPDDTGAVRERVV